MLFLARALIFQIVIVMNYTEGKYIWLTLPFTFRYKRIFSVGNAGITTYNPGSMEVTNQWYYHDFINITPALKGVGQVFISSFVFEK